MTIGDNNTKYITMNLYELITELNKLKLVFRNTVTEPTRRESTAEHSWSAAMITMLSMPALLSEFSAVDELKAVKLALIHDIVEVYAGDVFAFDIAARKDKEAVEREALNKLVSLSPMLGQQLYELWHEFENRATLEAKIAKASDAICPVFQRITSGQSYIPFGISLSTLKQTKQPAFAFSKTYSELFDRQCDDLVRLKLIEG